MVLPIEMDWEHLCFDNRAVSPDVVEPHLPPGLSVDTHDGMAWLSVVPFRNRAVRPSGVPAGFGLDLPELNLRTYVTCDGEPGVYFFTLEAEGVLGVTGARLFHHLPYRYARISLTGEDGGVRFRSRRLHPGERAAHYDVRYQPTGEPFRATEDDLASFLTERYRFFAEGMDGTLRHTEVRHPPWTIAEATVEERENTLFAAHGFEEPEGRAVQYYGEMPGVRATTSARWRGGAR